MQVNKEQTYIFIDGSYFCFYRYYSIVRWWKNAHPDDLETLKNPFENPIFLEKFLKIFDKEVKELPKKLNLTNAVLFVGKDCKRENIWRNSIQDHYKGTRVKQDHFSPFIKMVYENKLFEKAGVHTILSHPFLEADDCIALSVTHLLKTYDSLKLFVITSDKDYLQLIQPRLTIVDASFKNIAGKNSSGDAKIDLFCKIVMGDTSDNIPSVLKKCGPKTAIKCWQNKEYFTKRITEEKAEDKLEKNTILIDFDRIPYNLKNEFYSNIGISIPPSTSIPTTISIPSS
jgi:5'-3' exonuclease